MFTFEKCGSCVSGSRQFKTTLFKGQLTIQWQLREKSSLLGSVFLNLRFWRCREGERFPGGSDGEDSARSAGEPGSVPGRGRSPEGGKADPSSVLAGRTLGTVGPGGPRSRGRKELDTTQRLTHTHTEEKAGERQFGKENKCRGLFPNLNLTFSNLVFVYFFN